MQMIRRIAAVVLIVAAIGVWFGMKPASANNSSYREAITAALADDTANNSRTEGAPQQAVVNGWTAKDLLTIIAREGSNSPVDERPAALLALLVIGLGIGLATTLQPIREPAMSSSLTVEESLVRPAEVPTL
jgi:hypothetical protein